MSWIVLPYEVLDLRSLADTIKKQNRPFDKWLVAKLQTNTLHSLALYPGPGSDIHVLQQLLLDDINRVIALAWIFDPIRFSGIPLRQETAILISQNPQGTQVERLNRLLLEDAYPQELSRDRFTRWTTIAQTTSKDGITRIPFLTVPNNAAAFYRSASFAEPPLPQLRWISPQAGRQFDTWPVLVPIELDATDVGFGIERVEIYGNEVLLATFPSAPYTTSWQNPPRGTACLLARLFDTTGRSTYSDPRFVEITALRPLPPRCEIQPAGIFTKQIGETLLIGVHCTEGTEPLAYQWLLNGTPLSDTQRIKGTKTPTLSIEDLRPEDEGQYSARISNAAGPMVTNPLILVLKQAC